MARFRSIPHEIEAFQFKGDIKMKPPQWFIDAVHQGKAQVTLSEKYGNYITILSKNQTEKALPYYWICLHPNGKIFVLDDQRFNGSFIPIHEEKEERCKFTKEMF